MRPQKATYKFIDGKKYQRFSPNTAIRKGQFLMTLRANDLVERHDPDLLASKADPSFMPAELRSTFSGLGVTAVAMRLTVSKRFAQGHIRIWVLMEKTEARLTGVDEAGVFSFIPSAGALYLDLESRLYLPHGLQDSRSVEQGFLRQFYAWLRAEEPAPGPLDWLCCGNVIDMPCVEGFNVALTGKNLRSGLARLEFFNRGTDCCVRYRLANGVNMSYVIAQNGMILGNDTVFNINGLAHNGGAFNRKAMQAYLHGKTNELPGAGVIRSEKGVRSFHVSSAWGMKVVVRDNKLELATQYWVVPECCNGRGNGHGDRTIKLNVFESDKTTPVGYALIDPEVVRISDKPFRLQ
ncbi:MAG: hypothetical protein ABIB65_05830 [Candidatus Margulisiibacteriota bacterium]